MTKTRSEKQTGYQVITVRLPGDELKELSVLATDNQETVSALIRKAVSDMLDGTTSTVPPTVNRVSSGATTTTVWHSYGGSFTEMFTVPDSPPQTVQGVINPAS